MVGPTDCCFANEEPPRETRDRKTKKPGLSAGLRVPIWIDQFLIVMQAISLRLKYLQAASAEVWLSPSKRAR